VKDGHIWSKLNLKSWREYGVRVYYYKFTQYKFKLQVCGQLISKSEDQTQTQAQTSTGTDNDELIMHMSDLPRVMPIQRTQSYV
jgi:hypothetical protein